MQRRITASRLTSKGQVTIPVEVCRALNAEEGDEILFTVTGDEAVMRVIKRRRLTDLYGALPATRPYPGAAEIRAQVRTARARRVVSEQAPEPGAPAYGP